MQVYGKMGDRGVAPLVSYAPNLTLCICVSLFASLFLLLSVCLCTMSSLDLTGPALALGQ
jgi:hypothetical protein